MTIIQARRIVHFVDDLHMDIERLAQQLDCSEAIARKTYGEAKHTVQVADVHNAISELKRLANEFGTTPDELVRLYA